MSQPLPPTGDDPDLPPSAPGHLHLSLPRRARLAAAVFFLIAASMAPWTVFLGFTLPPKYDAGHWDLLWTGFDVGLICVLGYAAWAAWFQRQIVATT